MPLILGAMAHFVPVLTRTGTPAPAVRAAAPLALVAGLVAALSFEFLGPAAAGTHVAAILALAAALAHGVLIRQRAQRTIGRPHPGLGWYLAAIACLTLALIGVLVMPVCPQHRSGLRLLHLHLNTLGFVGLTAIGTLHVLLPTAAGRPDAPAARRLRVDLPFGLGGVLLLAIGAAWSRPLSYLGLALLLWPVIRLGNAWAARYAREISARDGVAPSLALALFGLAGVLFVGAGHATGYLAGADAVLAFVIAFLLPLVTGAASQLLPVWLRPGPQSAWHAEVRRMLARYGGMRAVFFVCGGLLVGYGVHTGIWLAVVGLAAFVVQFARALALRRT